MKTTMYPATLGILRWLTETRENKAVTGKDDPKLADIAELLLAFTTPLADLKSMSDADVSESIDDFLDRTTPEDFLAMQSHAESELLKFTSTATTPKKPLPRRGILAWARRQWETIKFRWWAFLHA